MSNLSFGEKHKLETLLRMAGGYVFEFSNRTFQEFVFDSTGKNIFDEKYDYSSGSKANRLRAFWSKEPNHVVGKLLSDLLDHCKDHGSDSALYDDCHQTVQRLVQTRPCKISRPSRQTPRRGTSLSWQGPSKRPLRRISQSPV
jgi:hypothetical protein